MARAQSGFETRRGRAVAVLGLGLALTFLAAGQVRAQGSDNPVELPETTIFGMGARAMGMGMAYTAVSEDVSAIAFNPAGLSQIRRIEFSTGLDYDRTKRTMTHYRANETTFSKTSLDHAAMAYPVPTYRGSLVLAFAFNRVAPLNQELYQEGFALPITANSPGLFSVEDYRREGMVNAWTAAAAMDLSPNLSIGASVSVLTGSSDENLTLAQYRVTDTSFDTGAPDDPEDWPFLMRVRRSESLTGYTGSLGFLGHLDNGIRIGVSVDLPKKLSYDGTDSNYLEDKEKVDVRPQVTSFKDDITLPVTVRGGASWGRNGILLAGGLRWTDYSQINFEGQILAPPMVVNGVSLQREPAYRSVVAVNLGGEYQFPSVPVRVRAGFFTEPIPYKLIAADVDFDFIAGIDNRSRVYRDYPMADIVSDRKYWTAGAGVLIQDSLTLDVAYLHGSWERATPAGYENTTTYFPTVATREKVSQDRVFASTTFHFE